MLMLWNGMETASLNKQGEMIPAILLLGSIPQPDNFMNFGTFSDLKSVRLVSVQVLMLSLYIGSPRRMS